MASTPPAAGGRRRRRHARRQLDAGDAEALAPVARTRRAKELQDTLTCLFTVWDASTLRAVLCAIARHVVASAALGDPADDAQLTNEQPLPLPAGLFGPRDTAATSTWMEALWRLGHPAGPAAVATQAVARDADDAARYVTWARALVLGALWMSMAARDLLFVDSRELWMRLHARAPARYRTGAFMSGLRDSLDRFAAAGYRDPDTFVARCEGHWMYGFDPAADVGEEADSDRD